MGKPLFFNVLPEIKLYEEGVFSLLTKMLNFWIAVKGVALKNF